MLYLTKILLSALLIVAISELAKRTGFLGALLASLPLISIISIIWLYIETRDVSRIREFSQDVFWLVLPSLGFFLILPALLHKIGFVWSMALSMLATIVLYGLMLWVLPKFGIKLV